MAEVSPYRFESIEMCDIVKRFPGVIANDRVCLTVKAGEVHALLGENGAGKTTLMRVLYGIHQPDEGRILIDGKPVSITSPAEAIRHGIGMVHQHFMLVPTLTVAANVALGLPSSRGPLLDLDVVSRRIRDLSKRYGLQVDPGAYVWQLAVGEQQRVEILKALYRGAHLLIMDEPTAVLTPQEVDDLFQTLRQMQAEGQGVIFISHKLPEVMAISQKVTVLRDGRVVQTLKTADTNQRELARLMVGREVIRQVDRPPVEMGRPRLVIKDLWVTGDKGLSAVRGVNLEIHAGEILGVAGVSGNGQRELAEVIAGLRHPTRGTIELDDTNVTGWLPDSMIGTGLSYVSEERMRDGVIKALSVEENMMIEDYGKGPFSRFTLLNFGAIADHCRRLVRDFEIKTPSLNTKLGHLSGGNIQKLIMARELYRQPSVLIAAQPTRGVDIGSTEIHP